MGTALYKQEPATAASEVFSNYDKALELLACRMLAEPYNAHRVEADIVPPMLMGTFGEVIAECQKQFRHSHQYSPQSVAMSLNRDRVSLQNWTQRDTEIDLPAAFDMFRHAYEQWIEQQIAESVPGWLRDGMSSEEVKAAGDKIRKEKGISMRLSVDDGKAEFQKDLLSALDGKVIEYPVKTPLNAMRYQMPYFEPGEYCIIAGRTGMGKSYFAQNCIYHAAKNGIASVFLNLENKPKHMQKRLWQMETGVRFDQKALGGLPQNKVAEYMEAWDRVTKFPTRIFNPGNKLHQVLNAIRSEYYERGIQLAVLDYIQLLRGDSRQSRNYQIGEISAELRGLALELDIPILVLAQISRAAEKSADKRPNLGELKDSGDLEQDATSVLLLYRPNYYFEHPVDDTGAAYPDNYADIHIAKGRETGTGYIKCRFDPVLGFYDEDHFSTFQPKPAPSWQPPRQEPVNDEDIPF